MQSLFIAFSCVSLVLTACITPTFACKIAATPVGTVNLKVGEGVTLANTDKMFKTGADTSCKWTINCPSSEHRVLFQTVTFANNWKNYPSSSNWKAFSPNGTLLKKLSYRKVDMTILPHSAGMISWESFADYDDGRQEAYVSCISPPNSSHILTNIENFGLQETRALSHNGGHDQVMKSNKYAPPQYLMIFGIRLGEIISTGIRKVSVSGNSTQVRVYRRNGELLKRFTNTKPFQEHTMDVDDKGFVLIASEPTDWTVDSCLCGGDGGDGDAPVAVWQIVLWVGGPIVMLAGAFFFYHQHKKNSKGGGANNKRNDRAMQAALQPPHREDHEPPQVHNNNNNKNKKRNKKQKGLNNEHQTSGMLFHQTFNQDDTVKAHYTQPSDDDADAYGELSEPFSVEMHDQQHGGQHHQPYNHHHQAVSPAVPTRSDPYHQPSGGHHIHVVPSSTAHHQQPPASPAPAAPTFNDGRPLSQAQMEQMAAFMQTRGQPQ